MFKILVSLFILTMTSLSAISFDLGPLTLRLPAGVDVHSPYFRFYNDPICYALQNRHLLLIFIESDDDQSERILVEPYAFGYNEEGNVILQGFRIDEINLNKEKGSNGGKGYFGGVFSFYKKKDGWVDFEIQNITEIRVLKDSSFEIREEALRNLDEKNTIVEPICEI